MSAASEVPELLPAPSARVIVGHVDDDGDMVDADGTLMRCSACERSSINGHEPPARLVQVMMEIPHPAGGQFYNRYCASCVRVFAAAKVVGKEVRRKMGAKFVTLKRWRSGVHADSPGVCVHHPKRIHVGEMVTIWRRQSAADICVPCVDAIVALLEEVSA